MNKSKLDKLNSSQNLLIKQVIGIRKYSKVSVLNEVIQLETIEKLYYKHKIFFLRKNSCLTFSMIMMRKMTNLILRLIKT